MRRKAEDHCVHILVAGIEPRRGKLGAIRRIREHLRFQAQPVALTVDAAGLADDRAVEKVAGIELQARRGREHLQHAPGPGIFEPRCRSQLTRLAGHHEVVIVAASDAQLLVAPVADALADRARLPEVEGRRRDVAALAGRNQRRIDWRVAFSEQRESMTEHVARAREIEERVIGDIDDRRPVGRRAVLHRQLVALAERICGGNLQRAWIAAGTVRTHVTEHDACGRTASHLVDLPQHLVQTVYAAVQMVRSIVRFQRVLPAVETELAARNAVGIAADSGAEVLRLGHVVTRRFVAQHDIAADAAAIGNRATGLPRLAR